jgi:dTDP-4-amino-4,6-dideoxygalactose transaminase
MNETIAPVNTIPMARPFMGPEEESAVIEVLRSGWLSQGRRVAEFEARFAEYVGAQHAIAVSSCTTALHLALLTSGIGPDDEVICPSLSYIASVNAIVHVGGAPVFADIDLETYNLDASNLEQLVTPRTRAILVVHQIGLPAAINEIRTFAAHHNLLVIEDAACAIGSEYFGRRIGAPHGSIACFSFHPRKILTTGEGGMITTANERVAGRLRRLRQHAMNVSAAVRHNSHKVVFESYDEVGYNYRMTDLQAAVGLVQLGRMDDFLTHRRHLATRYSEKLATLRWLVCPTEREGSRHNFQSYMVRLTEAAPLTRDAVMQQLLEKGVSTRRGVMAIHRELPYRDPHRADWDDRLPNTALATDTTLILPLFHQMTEEDQDYVIGCIHNIARAAQ